MPQDHVLFVQNRSQRAGAQVSLSRLVTQPSIQGLYPHVILGTKGWLNHFLTESSVSHDIRSWPSPRSLSARLGGLRKFAQVTVNDLAQREISLSAIIANDHQECLPALALAKAAGGVPVITILRTPGMTVQDFEKYRCNDCDHLFARGQELTEKVKHWSGHNLSCMLGSFSESDLIPPSESPLAMPTRILVAGSEEPRKGFQDLIQAIQIVEKVQSFPALEIVFTGTKTQSLEQLIQPNFRSQFKFVGRIDDFKEFAKEFQLAIHPSRAETFGMAPFELILAGVPTMLRSTGAASSLAMETPWIFPPKSPDILAEQLVLIWKKWQNIRPDMTALQKRILDTYPISASANALAKKIQQLT